MAKSKYEVKVKSRFKEIKQWLNDGLYEKDIITKLGVCKTTFESYKHKYPELFELLISGREYQNHEVTNSLYKNATGYYYYVDEIVKVKTPDGGEKVETITVKKFKPPETEAAKYWLKNRDKKQWADNPQMIDLRREEFEFKKQQEAEFKDW